MFHAISDLCRRSHFYQHNQQADKVAAWFSLFLAASYAAMLNALAMENQKIVIMSHQHASLSDRKF